MNIDYLGTNCYMRNLENFEYRIAAMAQCQGSFQLRFPFERFRTADKNIMYLHKAFSGGRGKLFINNEFILRNVNLSIYMSEQDKRTLEEIISIRFRSDPPILITY